MGRPFFTADWHLDHARILTYCRRLEFMNEGERQNFLQMEQLYQQGEVEYDAVRSLRYSRETVDRMNSSIIDNTNAVVGENDDLWIAGDIIFGSVWRLKHLLDRIVCRNIHIVWGNHDKDMRHLMRPDRFHKDLLEKVLGGEVSQESALEQWQRHEKETTDRRFLELLIRSFHDTVTIRWEGQKILITHTAHAVWDKSHRGVWHCYGHSHGNFEHWREEHLPNAKMVDIGIDYRARLGYGYTPWSFEELKGFMDGQSGQAVDHHGKKGENGKRKGN